MAEPAAARPAAASRHLGAVAAYAGGAVTAAGALGVGVLLGQVLHRPADHPGRGGATAALRRRVRARVRAGEPALRLAVLGDSTAAGYGVHTRAETPGALLASAIADAAQRPVRLTCPAVVGSVSAWLPAQAETVLEAGRRPRRHLHRRQRRDHRRERAARRPAPRRGGAGAARRGRRGRRGDLPRPRHDPADPAAAALAGPAVEPPAGRRADGRRGPAPAAAPSRSATCSARASTRHPDTMFGADRYHPSAEGYRAAVEVVLPTALRRARPAERPHAGPDRLADAARPRSAARTEVGRRRGAGPRCRG